MISWGSFEVAAPKNLEDIKKNVWVGVAFNKVAQIQSAAYHRTKNSTTDTFQEGLRKEKMF